MSYVPQDGVYVLEIHHQSGKTSYQHFRNSGEAWSEFQHQRRCYGKRALRLYAVAGGYGGGGLIASHR